MRLTQKTTIEFFYQILKIDSENKKYKEEIEENGNNDDFDINYLISVKEGKKIAEFDISQSFFETRNNTYYKLKIFLNGEKKDISILKKFVESPEDFFKNL